MTCQGIIGTALLLACLNQPPPSQAIGAGEWTDPSPHRTGFVTVNGLSLHYLDWGGDGEPLLLLAGLFGSAHAFDDLAPRLTRQHRVVALTRRGHGRSATPQAGYGLDVLVEDVRGFLDALRLDRVHVAGTSAGGVEAALFAARHPDRVGRVVYLDAAYDRSAAFQRKWASRLAQNPVLRNRLPFPPVRARDSFAAFREWYEREIGPWSPAVEADTREMYLDADGQVKPFPASMTIAQELIASGTASPPDYAAVAAPALAVFAVPGRPQVHGRRPFPGRATFPFSRAWKGEAIRLVVKLSNQDGKGAARNRVVAVCPWRSRGQRRSCSGLTSRGGCPYTVEAMAHLGTITAIMTTTMRKHGGRAVVSLRLDTK